MCTRRFRTIRSVIVPANDHLTIALVNYAEKGKDRTFLVMTKPPEATKYKLIHPFESAFGS